MPKTLGAVWHARGYYGSLSHNVKAVYQRYLSWYDAHPANLHALPPVPAAKKTIEYMGGIEAVLTKAQIDFDIGEYRWVAEVMKHAVYAHPEHLAARALAAEAMEQMGFQAESATWRNAFLLAAQEYRNGTPKPFTQVLGGTLLPAVSNELLFDALAVRWNATRGEDVSFSMLWHFTDTGIDGQELWLIEINNGAMNSIRVDAAPSANITLKLARSVLQDVLQQKVTPADAVQSGQLQLSGDTTLLRVFFTILDKFAGNFPVVDAATLPE
jgi:alkyl sulfatase BDS1-like metallo-beta-lactamase superfamily hydrolase